MNNKFIIILIVITLAGASAFHACGRKGAEDPPDTTPPIVISTSPYYNEQDVPVNVSISVTFNEEMDASTINNQTISLIMTDKTGTTVMNGLVTCSGAVAAFTPEENLRVNSEYSITISAGIKDVAGNVMVGPYACPFRTGTAVSSFSTITATAGANGSISPSGSVRVDPGASQTFNITPSSGYHVADVMVDGRSLGALTTYTFSNVAVNHTISASFDADSAATHTINASVTGGNGTIKPSGAVIVNQGADQSFTMAPSTGYHLADVVVDGHSVGAVTTYAFNNVAANHTITARFAVNAASTYTITAGVTGGNGTITPSGTVIVNPGSDKAFAIKPYTGYSISVVLVDGVSVGPVASYKFENVTANHTITASFERTAYTISTVVEGQGAVQPESLKVNYNERASFMIIPADGYRIDDVRGCRGRLSGDRISGYIYRTGAITGNCTVTARFQRNSIDDD